MFKIISGVDTEKLLGRHFVIFFQPPRAKMRAKILKRDLQESEGAKHKKLPVNDFPIYCEIFTAHCRIVHSTGKRKENDTQ